MSLSSLRSPALLVLLLATLPACELVGPPVAPPDSGTPSEDGGTLPLPDGGEGEPDGGADAGWQPGDGGSDAGEELPEGEPLAAARCFELENVAREGQVQPLPGAPETVGGTVTPAAAGKGRLRVPFVLEREASLRVWVRARAVTPENNGLSVALDSADTTEAATWDIPPTPVLRWQQVKRRGQAGTALWPHEDRWPRTVAAGEHTVVLSGLEPGVELDALCLMPPNQEPTERFATPPERAITHSLADFGAVGDGVADDTLALQAAFDALSPGDALHLPRGRYRFTQRLDLRTSGVTLMGEGADTVLFADLPATTPGSTLHALNIESPLFETGAVALLRDAPMLSRTVVVAATETGPFAAGDMVQVRSNDWGPPAPNNVGAFFRNRAALASVVAVETKGAERHLTLDRPLLGAFLTSTGSKVELYQPLREVVLTRFVVEGTSHADPAANADLNLVGVKRCARCFFTELGLKSARKAALDLYITLDAQVAGLQVSDSTDTGGGGHGYGVTLSRSQGGVVRDSHFFRVLRHGVPISWGSRESFIFRNRFDRSIPHTNNIASIDIHGQDDYANLVEANHITGGQPGIIVGGGGTTHGNDGPWNVLRNNRLEDTITGISVHKETYDTIIDGNVILHPNAPGVTLDSGSHKSHVWRNHIESYLGAGVSVDASDEVEVHYNTFVPGTGPAVRLFDSSLYRVQHNWLNGQAIQHPGTGTTTPNN